MDIKALSGTCTKCGTSYSFLPEEAIEIKDCTGHTYHRIMCPSCPTAINVPEKSPYRGKRKQLP